MEDGWSLCSNVPFTSVSFLLVDELDYYVSSTRCLASTGLVLEEAEDRTETKTISPFPQKGANKTQVVQNAGV